MPFVIRPVQADQGTKFFSRAVQRRLTAARPDSDPIHPAPLTTIGRLSACGTPAEFGLAADAQAPDIADRLAADMTTTGIRAPKP